MEDGLETIVGNLNTPDDLRRATHDVEVVFHCAGGGKIRAKEDFRRQNTDSTIHLANAFLEQNPHGHFIFASSLAARGPSIAHIDRQPSPTQMPCSLYGKSKREAEDYLLTLKDHIHVTIFRPPAMYGPGDFRWLPFFRSVQKRIIPVPPGQSMSMIFGPDCAAAMVKAMHQKPTNGSIFYVDDGEEHPWDALIGTAEEVLRATAFRVKIPSRLLWAMGLLNEVRASVTNQAVVLTRDKWRDAKEPHWVSDARITREQLDWRPSVTLKDGFKQTVSWYKAQGHL